MKLDNHLLESCALLRDVGPLAELSPIQWTKLSDLAIEDGVAGWFYWHSMDVQMELPEEVALAWGREYRHCAEANFVALHKLSAVLTLLNAEGIEPIVMPGAPLLAVYPDPGCRPMDDIDLLITEEQAPATAALLSSTKRASPFGVSRLTSSQSNAVTCCKIFVCCFIHALTAALLNACGFVHPPF